MGPLRDLGDKLLETEREMIRPIGLVDFKNSLEYIKPSVSQDGLVKYEKWASQFGSSGFMMMIIIIII
ncbi:Protein SAP1 [Saccharomyces cerevisiae]|nr:Protein SAP1 [Saccharomyces cerevisiae]